MFVLTNRGLFIFGTLVPRTDSVQTFPHKSRYPSSEVLLSTGIVIPSRAKLVESQVWCCPEKGGKFKIFSGSDPKMHGVQEIPIPAPELDHDSHVEHLQSYDMDGRPKLVVGDRIFLQSWDVLKKEKVGDDFNCYLACESIYGPENGKLFANSSVHPLICILSLFISYNAVDTLFILTVFFLNLCLLFTPRGKRIDHLSPEH